MECKENLPVLYGAKNQIFFIDSLMILKLSIIKEKVMKVKGKAEALRNYNYPYEAIEESLAKASRTVKRNLIPDSYFELELNKTTYNYFLEYDTGRMDKKQLAKKKL